VPDRDASAVGPATGRRKSLLVECAVMAGNDHFVVDNGMPTDRFANEVAGELVFTRRKRLKWEGVVRASLPTKF